MLTIRQHEKLIDRVAGLSELELDGLLKDIAYHLRKNNLRHLIDNAFQPDDYEENIADLESDLNEMEDERNDLKEKLFDVRVLCEQAADIEEYDENAFDSLKALFKEIEGRI